MSLNRS